MRERVELVFKGLMLEKFVQLCVKRKITFEGVERLSNREALLLTDRKGADGILDIAREYSLDIKQVSSRGPGAVLKRVKDRWTLLAAFVLVGCLAMSALSRIWIIDINMLDGTDPSGIELALDGMGVTPGVRLTGSDARRIQAGISARCADYAYVGASVHGVALVIEATKTFPVPDVYEVAKAYDIVAAADAVVLSVDVLAGTPMVVPGQTVRKGDVLIAGTERDTRETVRQVNARGSVMGRMWFTGEARVGLVREEVTRTGRKSVKAELRLWDFSHVLSNAEGFKSQQAEEEFFPVGGIIAPLGVLKTTFYETTKRKVSVDIDKTRGETLARALEKAVKGAPEGASVYDEWTDCTIEDNKVMICRALVEMRLDIARDGKNNIGG